MAITQARKRANAKYEAKAYDKTLIRLPKGRLDEIRTHADGREESLNGFIGRAIDETMERDKRITSGKPPKTKEEKQAAMERLMGLMSGMPEDIDPDILRDERLGASEIAQQASATSQGGGVVSLPSEALKAAQAAAEAAGEDVPQFVARAVTTQAQRDKLTRNMKPR